MFIRNNMFNWTKYIVILLCFGIAKAQAETFAPVEDVQADRIDIVTQQIVLLKDRFQQAEKELAGLKRETILPPNVVLEQASKNLLDKAALDITVAKSNLDSVTIELADAKQTVTWLDKNIQEINNQLNVLKIFGPRIARSEMGNVTQLQADLTYQEKLNALEKERLSYLTSLQYDAKTLLEIKKDQLVKLNAQLKSQRMLRVRQQEVRDELMYQEQQNKWLQQLSHLYTKLAKINPGTAKDQYAELEDEIFIASEHANAAYTQSLIARYRDQVQQLRGIVLKSNSISQLNELREQVDLLNSQLERLDTVVTGRINMLRDHVSLHATTSMNVDALRKEYVLASNVIKKIDANLDEFRLALDKALQAELSARQGFPSFDAKSFVEIGKELLLVPAFGFQVVRNLTVNMADGFKNASASIWGIFVVTQGMLLVLFVAAARITRYLLTRVSNNRNNLNSKWISLKWLDHHFLDLYLLMAAVSTMSIFGVPFDSYVIFVYLAAVWFLFKTIIVIARICLVESTSHTAGKDMRLYKRLMWIFAVGGVVTAGAVFVYQLPLVYELKTLSDRLFLLFMMIVSVMLLRFWDVVPNLILSHMEKRHPYFEKTIRVLGVLIPLLLFTNSAIGLLGYLNLVMTVSWYEGVLVVVLVAYLLLRGLLTDGVEQLSRIAIMHSSNGWLLTEAFLKPLDRILRLSLLIAACALLFAFYGWDQQSPIVERLNMVLHHQLFTILNTGITPFRIICLFAVISVFYWTAKWAREFVFRLLANRTEDMGIRNSVAILSQYMVIMIGVILCLQVLGINSSALAAVTAALAFGVGLGLRDLANNFFCGFLILLERPLRVGDIIAVNGIEGEVINIGSRAVTVMTWDHTALVVPNTEIFNKTFTNLTARDNVLRCVVPIKISRHDNPHLIQKMIERVIHENRYILEDPVPEVFLKEMNDILLSFELRFYVNIRQIKSRTMVVSELLMAIWDAFERHGIRPPYPQQEIFIRGDQVSTTAIVPLDHLEDRPLLRET